MNNTCGACRAEKLSEVIMTDATQLQLAQTEYRLLCDLLDSYNWHYDKDDANLTLRVNLRGDDLPIPIRIIIDADRQLAILHSGMVFEVPEDMRNNMAVAVSCANHDLADGIFDYDVESGNIVFRIAASFMESLIGKEVFDYMVAAACHIVDDYNDKFAAIVVQKMSIEDILNYIK